MNKLEIPSFFNGKIVKMYPVEHGMILEHKHPWSNEKYFKVISVGDQRPDGSWYLSTVRSNFPDVFPEFGAGIGRNGDTGFNLKNMDEFVLIRLPFNPDKR